MRIPLQGIALEITTIHGQPHAARSSHERKFAATLDGVAAGESLGSYVVAIGDDPDFRELRRAIPELMRRMTSLEVSLFRPGHSSWESIPRREAEKVRFYEEHKRLKDLGLVEVQRSPSRANRVHIFRVGVWTGGSLARRLETEAAKNAMKLGESDPRESHLAIELVNVNLRASDLGAPGLPAHVDCMWVFGTKRFGATDLWLYGRNRPTWTRHRADLQAARDPEP
jgi:hypothetical protein